MRPAGPAVADNTAYQQPPPPAGASSFASSDPHAIQTIVNVEEKKKQLQLMAPATINDDVASPSTLQQEEQNLHQHLAGCQDPFSGVRLTPVQLQQPSQNWPIELLGHESQPPMHQVQSSSAFGSIGYAEMNPFDVAHPPLLPAFPPAPFRDPFAVSSVLPTSTNDWTGSAPKFYLEVPPGFERLPNIPSKLVDSHSMIQEQRPVVFLEVPPGFERLPKTIVSIEKPGEGGKVKGSEACPKCIHASEQTVQMNEKLRMSQIEVKHLKKKLSESQLALEQKEERIRILEEKLHEKEILLNLKNSEVQSLHTEKRQMEEKNERNEKLIKQLKFEQMQAISSTTTEETEQDFYFLNGEKRVRLRGGDPRRSDDEERMEIERERLIPPRYPNDVEFAQNFEAKIWRYMEEHGVGPRDAMSLLFWNEFIEAECQTIEIKSPYLMQSHFNQVMLKNLWEREMRRDSKAYLLQSMGVSVTDQQHTQIEQNDRISAGFTPVVTYGSANKKARQSASPENIKKFLEFLLRKLSLPNPPTLGSRLLFAEFVETIGGSNGEQWRKQWSRTLHKKAFDCDLSPSDILKVYKEYRIPLGENKKKMEEKFGVLITEKDGCIVDTRVNNDSIHLHLKDDTDEG